MEAVSVVITVKNDEPELKRTLGAIRKGSLRPAEVVIIRAKDHENCSRSKGRNIGVMKSKHNIIAVTDAGCIPHRDWLFKITEPIRRGEADVVGGFYRTIARTTLQRAVSPFLSVMPDQWTNDYLPASRSISFTKSSWSLVGGYPENSKTAAEDIAFASLLFHNPNLRCLLVPRALVDWKPPSTLMRFWKSVFDHSVGNIEALYFPHILRNGTTIGRWILFSILPILIPFYLLWPILKHHRSVRNYRETLLLPVIQLLADSAIISAIPFGLFQSLVHVFIKEK